MVSFDAESLYSDIPIVDTINLIAHCICFIVTTNHIFPNEFLKIWWNWFDDKLCKQIDSVIIGAPLGPTLANFYLDHLEN